VCIASGKEGGGCMGKLQQGWNQHITHRDCVCPGTEAIVCT